MSKREKEAVKRAVRQAGGPVKLAARLGKIKPQAISQWRRCPAERVLEVSDASGVAPHELRPDLYTESMSEARANDY